MSMSQLTKGELLHMLEYYLDNYDIIEATIQKILVQGSSDGVIKSQVDSGGKIITLKLQVKKGNI
jgi:hypothetical protein